MVKSTKGTTKGMKQPHDKLYKKMMGRPEVARELLRRYLPKPLLKKIDLNYLEPQPNSFVSDVGKEFRTDITYKTKIDNEDAYITLLIEHQRTPDPLMPFRILQYMCQFIGHYLDTHKRAKKIPLIYPLILYNGDKPYKHSTDLRDIVAAPKALVDAYFLQPFQLMDLTQIDDSDLKKDVWSGVMLMALKHAVGTTNTAKVIEILKMLSEIYEKGEKRLTIFVVKYIMSVSNLRSSKQFVKTLQSELPKSFGEKVMSIADQLREEGLEQGLEEGKQQVALKLLKETGDIQLVRKVTGFTASQMKRLQKDGTKH